MQCPSSSSTPLLEHADGAQRLEAPTEEGVRSSLKSRRALRWATAATLAMASVMAWRATNSPTKTRGSDAAAAMIATTPADDDVDEYFEVTVDLTSHASVQRWIYANGVNETELPNFVPSEIQIRMWPARVEGVIGEQASDGHVTFNIAHNRQVDTHDIPGNSRDTDTEVSMSWTIVMSLKGEIIAVEAAPAIQGQAAWVNALKPKDPDTYFLGLNQDNLEFGPVQIWNWKDGTSSSAIAGMSGAAGSSHDLQYDAELDAVWMISGAVDPYALELLDVETGKVHSTVTQQRPYAGTGEMEKFQILERTSLW